MALVIADRVRETSSSTGTGTITLTGAFLGFQPFSVIGDGNTTYYAIIDATAGAFEVGIGTFTTSGNTLSRSTVLSSSNSGNLVNFAAGLKDVICTQPSARAVYVEGTNIVANNSATLPITTVGGLGTGVATFLATPSSANLAAAVTDETGSGSAVFATSPTLVTPALGTPASGVVTNLTGTASININGTVGATTPATGSFTSLTDSGNLAFTGTGNRITGDFSNATVNNRAGFQSSTGSFTSVNVLGPGASQSASIDLILGNDATNTSRFHLLSSTADARLSAGIYGTGTHVPMTFHTGGSEKVRIDTSGNVGIGTNSPTFKVEAIGSAPAFFGENSTNGTQFGFRATIPSNSANCFVGWVSDAVAGVNGDLALCSRTSAGARILFFTGSTTPTERMRIDSAGNVGIGESSPGAKLDVVGAATAIGLKVRSGGNSGFNILDVADVIGNGRVIVDPSGNLLVGQTASDARIAVTYTGGGSLNGLRLNTVDAGTSTAVQFVFNANTQVGTITTTTTATAYNTSSDYRLKENLAPMQNALATVAQLKPCTYNWKADGSAGQGFIAHELQEVAAYAVSGEKDGEQMQGVDYGKLTPILTAALQEAIAEIQSLKARVAELEAK